MKAIIFALVAHFLNAFRFFLPGIVGRAMTTLGIGLFVYNVVYPPILAFIQSKVAGLPALLIAYFGATGLDVVTTIWLSVFIAKAVRRTRVVSLARIGG